MGWPEAGERHARVRTIGLDIAKSVFPVHGIDEASCHDASLAWKRVQRRIISRASSRAIGHTED